MPIVDTSFIEQNEAKKREQLNILLKKTQSSENYNGNNIAVVILAAGLGKRMKNSDMPKVMFELCGKPMIQYVIELALALKPDMVIAIVGYKRELVIDFIQKNINDIENRIMFTVQEEQLGTGHAVLQTKELLARYEGEVLILSGDVPVLKIETLRKLIKKHFEDKNFATLLTVPLKNPEGYGRIVRDDKNNFLKITEEKDATDEEKKIKEINPAIYIVNSKTLFETLPKIKPENKQKEYYLTDIFNFIPKEKVGIVATENEIEVTGVNSAEQLEELEKMILEVNK